MGDEADWSVEQAILDRYSVHEVEYSSPLLWGMKDGRWIEPKDMSSGHIMNCVHLLERRFDNAEKLIQSHMYLHMVALLMQRGELDASYWKLKVSDRLNVRRLVVKGWTIGDENS